MAVPASHQEPIRPDGVVDHPGQLGGALPDGPPQRQGPDLGRLPGCLPRPLGPLQAGFQTVSGSQVCCSPTLTFFPWLFFVVLGRTEERSSFEFFLDEPTFSRA